MGFTLDLRLNSVAVKYNVFIWHQLRLLTYTVLVTQIFGLPLLCASGPSIAWNGIS
jgi:hypothetical protein